MGDLNTLWQSVNRIGPGISKQAVRQASHGPCVPLQLGLGERAQPSGSWGRDTRDTRPPSSRGATASPRGTSTCTALGRSFVQGLEPPDGSVCVCFTAMSSAKPLRKGALDAWGFWVEKVRMSHIGAVPSIHTPNFT